MKNKIMKFISEKFGNMRGLYLDGQPWLFARDVCRILGLADFTKAAARLGDDEKQYVESKSPYKKIIPKTGDNKIFLLINEPGLYHLIFTSRLPEAREFQHWVFHEVLPSIRKTGEYRLEWSAAREDGKVTRRKLTDQVAELFTYAVGRDEFHHEQSLLFVNYTRLVNRTLGLGDARDDLTAKKLFELDTCEYICQKTIAAGMAAGKSQHEIFEECREKLAAWRALTE